MTDEEKVGFLLLFSFHELFQFHAWLRQADAGLTLIEICSHLDGNIHLYDWGSVCVVCPTPLLDLTLAVRIWTLDHSFVSLSLNKLRHSTECKSHGASLLVRCVIAFCMMRKKSYPINQERKVHGWDNSLKKEKFDGVKGGERNERGRVD